jgi:hypothetical protein
MQKLILGSVRRPIADALGLCDDDPRVVDYANEGQEALMNRGPWVNTRQRYRIRVTESKVTWPRQVNTIESIAFDKTPGTIRNEWYEFLPNALGLLDCDDCLLGLLVDRGTACVFDDISNCNTNRKVRAYCDLAADEGKYIIVQGYDENNVWIRTQVDGEYIDGERIALSAAGTLSTKFFTSITGIQKDVTQGAVRLYEYNNTTALNVKALGYYEPDETLPLYRRSFIPGVADADEDQQKITVTVKLRHIPVVNDSDWLIIGNRRAFVLAAQAIAKERKDLLPEAEVYWGKAIKELETELRNYLGDGAVVQPRIQYAAEFGAGQIGEMLI